MDLTRAAPQAAAIDVHDADTNRVAILQELTAAEFDALAAPTEDEMAKIVRVKNDTNRAGALAYPRKTIGGDPEWFTNADTLQVPLESQRTFTNLGAGDVSLGPGTALADLTDYKEVRLGLRVMVAGNTGRVRLAYDNGDGEADLTSNYAALSTTGYKLTDWEAIPAGAKVPVQLKYVGYNGDGSEDPQIINVIAHFRR